MNPHYFLQACKRPSCHPQPCRVRFLLGGRHGEFKFLPPSGYAPCFEAVLPREKLKLEASQDQTVARDLLGPTVTLSQAAFTPTPVDTSQVVTKQCFTALLHLINKVTES